MINSMLFKESIQIPIFRKKKKYFLRLRIGFDPNSMNDSKKIIETILLFALLTDSLTPTSLKHLFFLSEDDEVQRKLLYDIRYIITVFIWYKIHSHRHWAWAYGVWIYKISELFIFSFYQQ